MKREIFTNKTIKLSVCLLLSALLLAGCGKQANTATVATRTGSALKAKTEESVETEAGAEPEEEDLYIIENLDMANETISLYSVSAKKQQRFSYNMTTKFMDKYGSSSSWASFTTGQVVTIGDKLPASGALSEVKKAGDVWVYEDVTNYTIDTEKDMLTTGGSNYHLTTSTKYYSDAETILATDIGENDTLTVTGKDKTIISVSVTTGHGYLHLTNTSLFDDSLAFIGKKIVTMLNGDTLIEVPEGTYAVTVANDGWGGTGEYQVTRNETTEVNLEDLKGEGPSYCDLTFEVTAPDTYVYLDGILVDTNEVQQVRYGSHKLVVNCEGYTSWDKTLVVNSASATITLEMSAEDSSSDEDEDSTDDTSTETSSASTNSTATDAATAAQQIVSDTTASTSSTSDSDYDYETDYLSTISDLISNLMN